MKDHVSRGAVLSKLRGSWYVLLVYENKKKFRLPGGRAEGSDSPAETFAREVKEETGVVVMDFREMCRAQYEYEHVYFVSTRAANQLPPGPYRLLTPSKKEKITSFLHVINGYVLEKLIPPDRDAFIRIILKFAREVPDFYQDNVQFIEWLHKDFVKS